MLKAARISFAIFKKNIFLFSGINCAFFILLLLTFKYLNLLHIFGWNLLNYVILFFISTWQFKRLIKKNKGYIPFLQVFSATFFTGTFAFFFFAIFMFMYARIDPYITELVITNSFTPGQFIPFIIIFFQGSGGSIIVALIVSFYAARYEDGN